jgi:hypothetical protein
MVVESVVGIPLLVAKIAVGVPLTLVKNVVRLILLMVVKSVVGTPLIVVRSVVSDSASAWCRLERLALVRPPTTPPAMAAAKMRAASTQIQNFLLVILQ